MRESFVVYWILFCLMEWYVYLVVRIKYPIYTKNINIKRPNAPSIKITMLNKQCHLERLTLTSPNISLIKNFSVPTNNWFSIKNLLRKGCWFFLTAKPPLFLKTNKTKQNHIHYLYCNNPCSYFVFHFHILIIISEL